MAYKMWLPNSLSTSDNSTRIVYDGVRHYRSAQLLSLGVSGSGCTAVDGFRDPSKFSVNTFMPTVN